jgi:hypothetical protein
MVKAGSSGPLQRLEPSAIADLRFLDKSFRERNKHMPDNVVVLFPERS